MRDEQKKDRVKIEKVVPVKLLEEINPSLPRPFTALESESRVEEIWNTATRT